MFRLSLLSRAALSTYAQQTGRRGGVLFTAGPINTSQKVREAQMIDYGSRDSVFVDAVKDVTSMLLDVANVSSKEWSSIPMQGSGTMGIEAAVASITPRDPENKKFLVIRNGAYSYRLAAVVEKLGCGLLSFDVEEGKEVDLIALEEFVKKHKNVISNVGVVHCETSTGMFNPVADIHRIARAHCPNATIFLDAMSSFGGVDFNVCDVCDVMVSSANKCIQGVPAFSIIVARNSVLEASRGRSPSFTLDIVSQWDGLRKSGQFNNTPPVQAIMAFRQALIEHKEEGGNVKRQERYRSIAHYVADEMRALGFKLFLDIDKPSFGHIITAYHNPTHPKWDFMKFYNLLNDRGFVIYPGKASNADTFRIGSLGDITRADAEALMAAVKDVMKEMDLELKPK
eukprot:Tbor_TRINITY_DN6006_c0_g7::TRINITY_DN6006_c0_g7_i1::g.11281::m.11281/K03430/phnW; 2-aminoethylphosphonate-pyruvate transaminase